MPLRSTAAATSATAPPSHNRWPCITSPSQHHRRLHLSPAAATTTSHLSPASLSATSLQLSSSKRRRFSFAADAVDSSQTSSTAGDKSVVVDDQFSLLQISFGVVALGSGLTLLAYGFGAYFNILPGSEWSAIMLTYGFPVAVIGMALQYTELKPVPCVTYSDAQKLREKCATQVLKQVKTDVTRYRYGDEQHLDEALKRIFQFGLGGRRHSKKKCSHS